MSTFEKQVVVDQMTMTANKVVLVREIVRIIENGNVVSETFNRRSFQPLDDVSTMPTNVQEFCRFVWKDLN